MEVDNFLFKFSLAVMTNAAKHIMRLTFYFLPLPRIWDLIQEHWDKIVTPCKTYRTKLWLFAWLCFTELESTHNNNLSLNNINPCYMLAFTEINICCIKMVSFLMPSAMSSFVFKWSSFPKSSVLPLTCLSKMKES